MARHIAGRTAEATPGNRKIVEVNGRSILNPHRVRVRAYDVTVEPEDPSVETFPVSVEQGLLVLHL